MTNKKLWLSLLAVVLIVCMLSVGLMSCKKKVEEPEEPDDDPITVEEQAATAIVEGIQNSLKAADLTDLKVDGEVGLTIGDKNYTLALALDLDLLQFNGYKYTQCKNTDTFRTGEDYWKISEDDEDEYVEAKGLTEEEFNASKTTYFTRAKKDVETKTASNTFLNAEIRDGETVLLGLYYWDANKEVGTGDNVATANKLYVQYYDEETQTQKMMKFDAPYVNAIMKKMGAPVDFHGIKVDELDFWDTIGGVLPVIASLADKSKTEYVENQKASITINLAAVLNNFSSVLSSANSFVEPLGLSLDLSNLGSVLPAISITLAAKFDSTGAATGVDLSLDVAQKNMEIKKIKNGQEGEAFLKINMDEDVKVGVSLNYKVGTATAFDVDFDEFKYQDNLIDVQLSLELFLGEPIAMNLAGLFDIEIAAGYYEANLVAAISPFSVLTKINSLKFDTPNQIIDSIKSIIDIISSVELTLQRTNDVSGAKVTEDPKIHLLIADEYSSYTGEKTGSKLATITTTVLGEDNLTIVGQGLDDTIEMLQPILNMLIKPSDESPATEGEETDTITPILTIVGKYLAGAYIGINDGTHGKIYAEFDSSETEFEVIPFSGYTEWTGTIAGTESFNFYTRETNGGYEENGTAKFKADETYYVRVGDEYRLVNKATEGYNQYRKYYTRTGTGEDGDPYVYTYDSNVTEEKYNDESNVYYVYVTAGYKKVNITEFAKDTTYYTYKEATYSKTAKTAAQAKKAIDDYTEAYAEWKADGEEEGKEPVKPVFYVLGANETNGDFGIGLSATLDIDENIEINATVTNLNIFGLPASLSATIKNLDIKLWQNDYSIFIDGNEAKLADLTASV